MRIRTQVQCREFYPINDRRLPGIASRFSIFVVIVQRIFAEDGISERISQASDGADSGKADGGLQSADQLRRGIEEASRDARGGEKEVNRAIEALAKSLGLWIPFENLSSLGSTGNSFQI